MHYSISVHMFINTNQFQFHFYMFLVLILKSSNFYAFCLFKLFEFACELFNVVFDLRWMHVNLLINLFINCIAMSDTLKPSHLGLDHEAQLVRTYRQSMNGANGPTEVPAIKYIHLHECDKFSVRIFSTFTISDFFLFLIWTC
jgi:hypothetical protein